jgi:hypothetical protein
MMISRLVSHSKALGGLRITLPRSIILTNLEGCREAFSRAKGIEGSVVLTSLDFAYRRERLYFEILLDVRDDGKR